LKRVLFLDAVHPILEERLRAFGFFCDHDYQSTYNQIKESISVYSGVVIRSRLPMDAALIAAAKNLQFIARSGAGLENIDLIAAREAGIAVVNSPEGNRDAVGEHAIGMLLMLFNKLHLADAEVRRGVWNRETNRGRELSGLTVGIIGYGYMGTAFAEKLQGFGCKILAYDKYKVGFGSAKVTECQLESILSEADVISLHLPLSEETKYIVDTDFIDAMVKPFYLINTARGMHVDTAALVSALESGQVLGACLDVIEYEKKSFELLDFTMLPEPFGYLVKSDKVILSPHVAGWTTESYEKLSVYLAEKILKLP
jgi:D-3-phosphoglycerate dehydrogenase